MGWLKKRGGKNNPKEIFVVLSYEFKNNLYWTWNSSYFNNIKKCTFTFFKCTLTMDEIDITGDDCIFYGRTIDVDFDDCLTLYGKTFLRRSRERVGHAVNRLQYNFVTWLSKMKFLYFFPKKVIVKDDKHVQVSLVIPGKYVPSFWTANLEFAN